MRVRTPKRRKTTDRIETDDRVEKSRKAVLQAVHELLTKSGLSGVSVDAVSRRSGIAKTTIYRHWPSRESLLLDACAQLSSRPLVPDTGKLKTDVEALAKGAAMKLHQPSATVMPSIIDAAERDKDLAELQGRMHAEMRGAFIAVIERAQKRRELSKCRDAREIVASILGPILYRRFFSREPLDEAFLKSLVQGAFLRFD